LQYSTRENDLTSSPERSVSSNPKTWQRCPAVRPVAAHLTCGQSRSG